MSLVAKVVNDVSSCMKKLNPDCFQTKYTWDNLCTTPEYFRNFTKTLESFAERFSQRELDCDSTYADLMIKQSIENPYRDPQNPKQSFFAKNVNHLQCTISPKPERHRWDWICKFEEALRAPDNMSLSMPPLPQNQTCHNVTMLNFPAVLEDDTVEGGSSSISMPISSSLGETAKLGTESIFPSSNSSSASSAGKPTSGLPVGPQVLRAASNSSSDVNTGFSSSSLEPDTVPVFHTGTSNVGATPHASPADPGVNPTASTDGGIGETVKTCVGVASALFFGYKTVQEMSKLQKGSLPTSRANQSLGIHSSDRKEEGSVAKALGYAALAVASGGYCLYQFKA